jgi:hypothetical protein
MKIYPLLSRLMQRLQAPETGGESGSTSGGMPAGTPSPQSGSDGETGRGADLRIAPGSSTDDAAEGHDEGNNGGDDATGTEGEQAPRRQRTEAERMQRRMDRRTRALGEKDQTIAQLQAELAAARGGRPAPRQQQGAEEGDGEGVDNTPAQPTGEEINRHINTQAQRIAEARIEAQRISDQTTALIKAGKALDPKFDDAAREVSHVIPFVVGPQGRESASPFIKALYECDHPAAILLHLNANPDELDDLADMPLKKQERQLLKLDIQLATAAATRKSGAPKPLEVITGGRSSGGANETRMTDEEWRAQRQKQRTQPKR